MSNGKTTMKKHLMTCLCQFQFEAVKLGLKMSMPKTINSHSLYYSYLVFSFPSDTVTTTTMRSDSFVRKADTLNGKGCRADLSFLFLVYMRLKL